MRSAHELFDQLYRDMRPELLRLAGRRVGLRGLAEDVVDDVFMRLWDAMTLESPPDDPEEWLREKVEQRARNQRRETRRRWNREIPMGLLQDDEEWPGPYPPLDFATAEFQDTFDTALRELDEPERDAFILTELRGLSARAAGDVIGATHPTVERRAEAARTYIRKELT